jgi:hypothetical protein
LFVLLMPSRTMGSQVPEQLIRLIRRESHWLWGSIELCLGTEYHAPRLEG